MATESGWMSGGTLETRGIKDSGTIGGLRGIAAKTSEGSRSGHCSHQSSFDNQNDETVHDKPSGKKERSTSNDGTVQRIEHQETLA